SRPRGELREGTEDQLVADERERVRRLRELLAQRRGAVLRLEGRQRFDEASPAEPVERLDERAARLRGREPRRVRRDVAFPQTFGEHLGEALRRATHGRERFEQLLLEALEVVGVERPAAQ